MNHDEAFNGRCFKLYRAALPAIIIIIVVKGLFSASTKTESTHFATNFLYPRANRKALHLIYSMPFVGIQQSLHTVGGFATDIT